MESIFKMAILLLFICIFAIFRPTIFKFCMLIEDDIRIDETFFINCLKALKLSSD
jgi:hypothetical protein